MAEGKSSLFEKLQSEVTCPLCLDIFTDPKKLPCDHVYCRACLHGLALRSITGTISCPECRMDICIPGNRVSDFPTLHQVNRLLEVYQENLKTIETEAAKPKPATCEFHISQPLALYCETCEKLICRDCALLHCVKKNHEHGFIDDIVKKYEANLSKDLEPARKLHQEMTDALESISTSERKLLATKETKVERIEKTFDAFTEILDNQRKYLISCTEIAFHDQKVILTAKANEMSNKLMKLESIIQSVNRASEGESDLAFLLGVAAKKKAIKECTKEVRKISPYPAYLPEMNVNMCSTKDFQEFIRSKNFDFAISDPLKCHTEPGNFFYAQVNEGSDDSLYLTTQNITKRVFGKLNITAELHCCHDGPIEKVFVKKISDEKYLLSYVPKKGGKHKIHVKYNDELVYQKEVFVLMSPQELSQFTIKKRNFVTVKFQAGKIYACEWGKGIAVLNSQKLSVEATIKMPGATCVHIDGPHIYATDRENHRVIKMDMNGTIMASTGSKGSAPGQFNFPYGITLGKDNELYVCDIFNDRIQVFDKDLNFTRILGRKGSENGCFRSPCVLDFDSDGNIYVTEERNCRVQVLTPQGQHVRYIGTSGSSLKELLAHPISLVVHRGLVYVTDNTDHSVAVYKTTGEFVKRLGEDIFPATESLTIDNLGFLYVTCNREVILKLPLK